MSDEIQYNHEHYTGFHRDGEGEEVSFLPVHGNDPSHGNTTYCLRKDLLKKNLLKKKKKKFDQVTDNHG